MSASRNSMGTGFEECRQIEVRRGLELTQGGEKMAMSCLMRTKKKSRRGNRMIIKYKKGNVFKKSIL